VTTSSFETLPDRPSARRLKNLCGSLARIIHQPEKLAKEGTLGLRMILRPVVSQEHRDPKTSASGLPGTAQIGLIVALRRTSSWQPFGAYNQLVALEPVTLFTALYRTG
jgi:hypothetical protein